MSLFKKVSIILSALIAIIFLISCVPSVLAPRHIPFVNRTASPDSVIEASNSASLYAERRVWSLWDGWKTQNHSYGHVLKSLPIDKGNLHTQRFLFLSPLLSRHKQLIGTLEFTIGDQHHSIYYTNKGLSRSYPDDSPRFYSFDEGLTLQPFRCYVSLSDSLRRLIDTATDGLSSTDGDEFFMTTWIQLQEEEFILHGSLFEHRANRSTFQNVHLVPSSLLTIDSYVYKLAIFTQNNRNQSTRLTLTPLPDSTYRLPSAAEEQVVNQLLYAFTVNQHVHGTKMLLESGKMKTDSTLLDDLLLKAVHVGWWIRELPKYQERNERLVSYLLQQGAQATLTNDSGESLVFISAMHGCNSTVRVLLHHGADIDLDPARFNHFLEYAVSWKNDSLFQLLMKHGIDIPANPSKELKEKLEVISK